MLLRQILKMDELKRSAYASLAMRLGLGIVLLIAGRDMMGTSSGSFFGKIIQGVYGGALSTSLAGFIQLALGIALIIGAFTRIAGWISALFFVNNLILVFPIFMQIASAQGISENISFLFILKDIIGLGASIGIGLLGFRDFGLDIYLREIKALKRWI